MQPGDGPAQPQQITSSAATFLFIDVPLGDSTFTVLVLADGREVAAERLTVRPDQVAGWDESRAGTAAARGEWRQVRREVHRALSAS